MKQETRAALDAYYSEAGSWAGERNEALRKSRRIAWIAASVATVVALAEAFALAGLAPLKTVVPYTLLVNRQTGYVEALRPLEASTIAPDAALTRSFLVQYVIARESFDIDAVQTNYRKVALWSADTARSSYVAGMQIANPDSPLARLPRSTIVDTRVKSVSPLGSNTALVRFETQRRDAGGQVQSPQSWVAVIRYRFSREPMSVDDRFLNPLGFQVVRYNRNAESIEPPTPSLPAQPMTATAIKQ